jgi:hypothetical protein
MKSLTPFWILLLIGMALVAWYLGGPAGAGVLAGGVLGLGLGAVVTRAEGRLYAARPERAFSGLVLGFLAKLAALLAATVLFLTAEPEGIDPAAFVLSFLAAAVLATAAGWLGVLRHLGAEGPTR